MVKVSVKTNLNTVYKRYYKKYNVRLPFLHLYKYHIIDLARQEKIDLSDTMSCIASIDQECGKCWQCMEKKWGIDQISC